MRSHGGGGILIAILVFAWSAACSESPSNGGGAAGSQGVGSVPPVTAGATAGSMGSAGMQMAGVGAAGVQSGGVAGAGTHPPAAGSSAGHGASGSGTGGLAGAGGGSTAGSGTAGTPAPPVELPQLTPAQGAKLLSCTDLRTKITFENTSISSAPQCLPAL